MGIMCSDDAAKPGSFNPQGWPLIGVAWHRGEKRRHLAVMTTVCCSSVASEIVDCSDGVHDDAHAVHS